MSIRVSLNRLNTNRRGHKGRRGDTRYGYEWAVSNAQILSQPMENLSIGDKKTIPADEIFTDRFYKSVEAKMYFNNTPPTPEMDLEDPHQDMTRIFNPIPKHIVKKGALFLMGQQKFKGLDSFKFSEGTEELKAEWERVWTENDFDSKVVPLAQCYLRDGDVFYKVVSEAIGNEVVSEELVNDKKQRKVREIADIKFIKTDPGNWSAIVSQEKANMVIAWVYQFRKGDGTFVREEYFRDRTLVYEGQMKEAESKSNRLTKAAQHVLNSLVKNTDNIDKIEFELKEIQEHNLGTFPIVRFKNNEQGTFWGMSVYDGHYGQFDRLNEVYTQTGYAVKMHADPLLWISGADNADQNVKAADAVWSFTSPEASLNILQWEGTPDSTFKFIELLESKIYADAFIPRTSEIEKLFGSDNRLSGTALRELKSDIIDATMCRRLDIEQGFKEMLELVAIISGVKIAKDATVDVVWGPVFESGSTEKRDALLQYHKNRVISRETLIELSDDFPPEMKKQLIEKLDEVDRDFESQQPDPSPTTPNRTSATRRTRKKRSR